MVGVLQTERNDYRSHSRLDMLGHDFQYYKAARLKQVTLKVASRCNLNCSYCYVYNRGDISWRQRPAIMTDDVFEAALARLREHCELYQQRRLVISFHGGEPCLVGPHRFDHWCNRLHEELCNLAIEISIQTNGTLLDKRWADVFQKHKVGIGVSLDGPPEINDANRVNHSGRGSHSQVKRGLHALQEAGLSYGFLCVIPLGSDPVAVHQHLLQLGCSQLTYLFPDITYDTALALKARHGQTPCADFLIPVFDEWWWNGSLDRPVGDLWNIARLILGGESLLETFGGGAPAYVFIESDGDIEGLDCLRVCKNGITATGLNVRTNHYHEIVDTSPMHGQAIFEGMPLPDACRSCQEHKTCAGGYLPHRYSSFNGFNNPSVWCSDILKLFSHIRRRLGVTAAETQLRRASARYALVASTGDPMSGDQLP
jgi:uncharacterized protein